MEWHHAPYGTGFLLCIVLSSLRVTAQPSGGPYGPIHQTYDLPAGMGKVYHVAPDGTPEESGALLTRPTTIETAFERVRTGDVIVMRGGTYRTGNLILNQRITSQPNGYV